MASTPAVVGFNLDPPHDRCGTTTGQHLLQYQDQVILEADGGV